MERKFGAMLEKPFLAKCHTCVYSENFSGFSQAADAAEKHAKDFDHHVSLQYITEDFNAPQK